MRESRRGKRGEEKGKEGNGNKSIRGFGQSRREPTADGNFHMITRGGRKGERRREDLSASNLF